ncbi:MAG: Cytoskeleton protein RodZ [Desulfovibrio sp.]
MTSQEFGELIRQNREREGLAIEELAARFKLSASTLRSIEDGSLENLPHAVYARGFVRSYAQAVGVASEDLEAGIEALFPQHLFDDVPTPPAPLNSRAARTGKSFADKLAGLLVVLVVIGVPLGAGWFIYTNYGDDIAELVKKPFSAMPSAQPSGEGAAPTAPMPGAPGAPGGVSGSVFGGTSSGAANTASPAAENRAAVTSAAAQTQPVQPQTGEASRSVPETPAAPAQPAASENRAEEPATAQPALEGNYVSLTAREECWVEVTVDGGGTRSFTVYPGEESVLPYKRKITIVLGNAGGIAVTHNNKPFPLTGKRNEKKTLTFP